MKTCSAKIEIQSKLNNGTVLGYCGEAREHEGRCLLPEHIALAYGVDRHGELLEPKKPAA